MLKEEVEDLRGQNKLLQTRVETLEDTVAQNRETISYLTKLVQNLGGQMKDVISNELTAAKQSLTKEIKAKMSDLEKRSERNRFNILKSGTELQEGESAPRDFTLMGPGSGGLMNYSGSKGKNSDSSIRNKQKNVEDMMSKLGEILELRVGRLHPATEGPAAEQHGF